MTKKSKVKVLHFVTGGFSGGATQIAVSLVAAAQASDSIEPLLVLRRKLRGDPARIRELEVAGIPVKTVPGWSKLATIWSLVRLCKEFQPDVLVAHGFSEHLWGRYAGLLAKVPHLVHVEHNTKERYNRFRLAQSLWLSRYTDSIVGCSEGVRQVLLSMGMPAEKTIAISNGIHTGLFEQACDQPLLKRNADIVMVSRYSKQKDHATLLKALALLKAEGLTPKLHLAGGGKAMHRRPVERLCEELGLTQQVEFLGVIRNVPELLMKSQIAVLSTHYEGMPLALLEGMAAGCIVIGSAVPGVKEVIANEVDGFLVAESDATELAAILKRCLTMPETMVDLAERGRQRAITEFSRQRMNHDYETLFLTLAARNNIK